MMLKEIRCDFHLSHFLNNSLSIEAKHYFLDKLSKNIVIQI